jgi:hypothetical protein
MIFQITLGYGLSHQKKHCCKTAVLSRKKGVFNLKWGMGGFCLFPRECVEKAGGAA